MSDRDAYDANGWVRVSGLFTPGELDALTAAADAFVAAHPPVNRAWNGAWRAAYGVAKQPMSLTACHDLHQASPEWAAVTADEHSLMAAVRLLIGPSAQLHQSTAIYKPPTTGQPFPLHQDAAYYGSEFPAYLIAAIHLDRTVPANGTLRVWPGVHQKGLLVHRRDGGQPFLDPDKYPPSQAVTVNAEAGDMVAMSLYTPHGSFPNTSDRPRRLVRLGFVASC